MCRMPKVALIISTEKWDILTLSTNGKLKYPVNDYRNMYGYN